VKYFVVNREEVPVAVVFHDHVDQVLYCRSKVTSFQVAFDAMCAKLGVELVREDDQGVLRAIHAGPEDYDWAKNVLDRLCDGFWSLGDVGTTINADPGIHSIIQQYLS